MEQKDCPCEEVRTLMDLTEKQEQRLNLHDQRLERGNVDFAVISTKLNIIMAVVGSVGVAICGVLISGLLT